MSITIAGRHVFLDDALYHTGFKAWGVVIGFDGGSARVQITGANSQPRIIFVQQGGRINGVRVMFWHEPLLLDLPFQNIDKYQRLIDTIIAEFPS